MTADERHIAQFNVARMRYPLEHPGMAAFAAALDRVNALADASPGFVWRLQDEDGDATALRPLGEDWLINMSVWRSIEDLRAFAYDGEHLGFLKQRTRWFEVPTEPHLVLWWVAPGHRPGMDEGMARLGRLGRDGPGAEAFTFAQRFEPAVPVV